MIVGLLEFELHIRGARSLKDKRRVVKSLKDRLRARFNISIAEVDTHEEHRLASLAIVMVGADTAYVQGALDQVRNQLAVHPEATLGRCDVTFL